MKYLCGFKKCAYIPLEEGTKLSFQQAVQRANLLSVNGRVRILIDYTVEMLIADLQRPKSSDIIFIDSVQYLRYSEKASQEITKFQFKDLVRAFPKKLFIFISHAKDGEPRGSLASAIYYDADVCIEVKQFEALPRKSRYGGHKPFQISKQ
jgi:predicted ATP-dependent serine protease